MKTSSIKKIKIHDEDMSIVEVEIDNHFLEFYKKETGRVHITEKGLSNFIENLVRIYQLRLFLSF